MFEVPTVASQGKKIQKAWEAEKLGSTRMLTAFTVQKEG